MSETITLIMREDCSYCDNAKAQLRAKGHTYNEKLIGRDIERDAVLKTYPDLPMLPIVVWEDGRSGGYEDLIDWLHPPLDVEKLDGNENI